MRSQQLLVNRGECVLCGVCVCVCGVCLCYVVGDVFGVSWYFSALDFLRFALI